MAGFDTSLRSLRADALDRLKAVEADHLMRDVT
jgi:hypothetical protein